MVSDEPYITLCQPTRKLRAEQPNARVATVGAPQCILARYGALLVLVLMASLLPFAVAASDAAVNLTRNGLPNGSPNWSPDGTEIAFVSWGGLEKWDIYVMGHDGANPTRLTRGDAWNTRPVWSPDGSRIAFFLNRDGGDIYVMDRDGRNQTNLTQDDTWNWDTSWSPDGMRIVFGGESIRTDAEVFVMDRDGTNKINLTRNEAEDRNPSWSPDGMTIAFASDRDGDYDIYIMSLDGSNQVPLTQNLSWSWGSPLSWSPDGTRIAFTFVTPRPTAPTTASASLTLTVATEPISPKAKQAIGIPLGPRTERSSLSSQTVMAVSSSTNLRAGSSANFWKST